MLVIIAILLCSILQHCTEGAIKCTPGKDSCKDCYSKLIYQITDHDENMFNLQKSFFPPDKFTPVFITVYYHYGNHSEVCSISAAENNTAAKVWFWSSSIFYLIQPLHVLQFTSLFFSDTAKFYTSEVCFILDPDCYNASVEHMRLLTQRVSCMPRQFLKL